MPSIRIESLPQPSHSFEWRQEPWGVALRCLPLLEAAPHLFTTRLAIKGEDAGQLDSMAASLGLTRGAVVQVQQVHGCRVAIVRFAAETPARDTSADVIVSDDPHSAVAVRVADCAPILVADRTGRCAAAVHAGWRGTAGGAVGAAVETMVAVFGSRRGDLMVAIGPSIGRDCYEVGPELLEEFVASGHTPDRVDRWFRKAGGDRWLLDVAGANRDQLLAAGVPDESIFDSGLCTHCHPAVFHSYRRDSTSAGRMLGMIRTRGGEHGRLTNVTERRARGITDLRDPRGGVRGLRDSPGNLSGPGEPLRLRPFRGWTIGPRPCSTPGAGA